MTDDMYDAIAAAEEIVRQAEEEIDVRVDDGIDVDIDSLLRPHTIADMVGQKQVRDTLMVAINAAKLNGHTLRHILLAGPPGIGKTTVANAIAHEMGYEVITTVGAELTKASVFELFGAIGALHEETHKTVLVFVDEGHAIRKPAMNVLLPVLESFVVPGVGPMAPFTFVIATTDPGEITPPLMRRLQLKYTLRYYSDAELTELMARNAPLLWGITDEDDRDAFLNDEDVKEALSLVAQRSRNTPAHANTLLLNAFDFGTVNDNHAKPWRRLDTEIILQSFEAYGIDKYGLNEQDRDYLATIIDVWGPDKRAGLDAIARSMSSGPNPETVRHTIEPYLMRCGYVRVDARGRSITDKGVEVITDLRKLGLA